MTRDGGAASAAALYAGGTAVLFGVRSWQQYRATGRTGFNAHRARDPWARVAGGCFLAAVASGLTAPLLARAGVLPVLGRSRPAARAVTALGTGLAAAGFGLAAAAQQAMGASWRIGVDPTERTDLVTSGVFAWVRNPIFTAMLTAQLGTTLMAPTRPGLLGMAALTAGCQVQVRLVEEPYLARTHGEGYREYLRQAGRFLPGLGRTHSTPVPSSSGGAG